MAVDVEDLADDERPPREALLSVTAEAKFGVAVARRIRDAIMLGMYRPGQKLVVTELAEQLGVSSMPVREALVSLVNEGLVKVLPRRGFAVSSIRRRDVEDIILVHAFVAGTLAARAAAEITSSTIMRLRETQRALERIASESDDASHRARVGDLNFEFHRTVNRVVDAGRLHWFLRAVTSYVPRNVYETLPEWSVLAVTEHPAIIDALEGRNGGLARGLTEEHVRHMGEQLILYLEAQGLWNSASV